MEQRDELKMTQSVHSRLRTVEGILHKYHSLEGGEQVYSILMKFDEANKVFVDERSDRWATAKYVPLEGSVANSVIEIMATCDGIKGGIDFPHRDNTIREHRPIAPYMKSDADGEGMKYQQQTLYNYKYAISLHHKHHKLQDPWSDAVSIANLSTIYSLKKKIKPYRAEPHDDMHNTESFSTLDLSIYDDLRMGVAKGFSERKGDRVGETAMMNFNPCTL